MSASSVPIGMRIAGRFELVSVIGSGGMGTVYRARDLTGDFVALKIQHAAPPHDRRDDRFLREARLLSELRHPGIVSYLLHGTAADGRGFLAMEWLDGEDLARTLRRTGGVPPKQALELLSVVAETLEFAHARGVLHRDVKPENIFICRSGLTKLLDFGIARRIESEHLTQTGTVIGTLEYMSPEQLRASRSIGAASDMYSLGCVLYQCLCGSPPFTGDTAAAIMARTLFEEPEPLATRRPDLPAELCALVHRLLSKEASARPATVSDVLKRLAAEVADRLPPAELRVQPVQQISQSHMTHGERRLVSAVLASGPRAEAVSDEKTQPLAADWQRSETAELAIPIAAHNYPGVRISALPNGWLLAVFDPVGQVGLMDQIVSAGLLAQEMAQHRPTSQVAISVCRQGGTEQQMVGPVVAACSQLLQRLNERAGAGAAPSGVWLDATSEEFLSSRFVIEKTEHGSRLLSARTTPNPVQRFLGKQLPCVGRESELSMLEMWRSICVDDSTARAVLLTAPPGVGKTRVVQEFLSRQKARGEPLLLLHAACDPLSEDSPYGALQKALRLHSDVQAGTRSDVQQQRLWEVIGRNLPADEKQRVVEFIGELSGVYFPAQRSPQLQAARHDPKLMSDQLAQALSDYLRAECRVQPVILVLEDLHFCDALTLAAIGSLLTELKDERLFVLAAGRPEVQEKSPRLWTSSASNLLHLQPLGKKPCARMAQQLLAGKAETDVIERVVQLADGNPLFLEELMRAVLGGHGSSLPVTVLAVLQQRIQQQPADARRTLRAASIFGDTLWSGGVAELLGVSAEMATNWLHFLCQAEIIERRRHSRFANETEYAFRHALMHEAVYQMVTEEDRVIGHGHAARFLIRAGENDAFVIAAHHEKAKDFAAAGAAYVRAAEQCCGQYDLVGTKKGAGRALELDVQGELRGVACSLMAQGLYWGTEWSSVPQWASQALELCVPGSIALCRALSVSIMFAVMHGRHEHIGALVGRFLSTEPDPSAIIAYVEAGNFMVLMFVMVGQRQLVEALVSRMKHVVAQTPSGSHAAAMVSFGQGTFLHLLAPQPWQAEQLLNEAYVSFQKTGDTRNAVLASCLLALAKREIGHFEDGEQLLKTALQAAERLKGSVVPTVLMHVALLLQCSDVDAHHQEAEAAAQVVSQSFEVNAVYVALAQGILSWCKLRRARVQGAAESSAKELISEALSLAERACHALTPTPTMQAVVLPLYLDVLCASGQQDKAVEQAERLVTLYQSLENVGYLEPIGRLAAAAAFRAAGREDAGHACEQAAHQHALQRAAAAPSEQARHRFLSLPENVRALQFGSSLTP